MKTVAKPFVDRLAEFVDRWSSENAGRYEIFFVDGERVLIHDCYLTRDLANRPDHVWVNFDSPGQRKIDRDIANVASIRDVEQDYLVIEAEKKSC